MVIMSQVKKRNSSFQMKEENQFVINEPNGEDDVTEELKIIAQEVKIVKSLGCNDLTERNKQIKSLRKWLQIRTNSSFPFTQEDFMRIWKGLYYNMWYSDKPLVQEELAEQLGKLLECFSDNLQYCVDFFGAFLKIMCIEWFGIDQWRIDKFLMLSRRMLRYMFKSLHSFNWSVDAIELFNKQATETVLFENVSAKGFTMHYLDIFFEELAKVSEGAISSEQVGMFVKPFVKFMATQRDFNLISHCRTRVFYHLLYQSNIGREYTEKYNAWKSMGFPTKNIADLEKVEESEKDDFEGENTLECDRKHLDPRAGNVDVFMPVLPLDAEPIIKETEYFLYKEECSTKRRKFLRKMLDIFKTYQNGEFPLGIKTMPRYEGKSEKPLIKEKIKHLDNMENELYGVDRKLKQMTKRRRRKFLKSLNFDEINESNYEQTLEKALPNDYLRERRKRSHKSFMSSWLEEELNEEDLKPKKIKKDVLATAKKFAKRKEPTNFRKIEQRKSKKNTDITEKSKPSDRQQNGSKITENNVQLISQINKGDLNMLKTLEFEKKPAPKFKKNTNEWDEPLADGETEYFLPSRKFQLKKANSEFVLNPLAKQRLTVNQFTPDKKIESFSGASTPKIPSNAKRVKIALKHNTSQNPIEYIQQIKSSPDIPYDAKRQPGKGLLKPNAMPSPINPFYKKKIGLKLLNDTI